MSIQTRTNHPDSGPQVAKAVTCFTPGTLITTKGGRRAVESLRPGDRALTRDNGFQPVIWTGQHVCNNLNQTCGRLATPVLIRADALAPGLPERDMLVSPQHRFLTTDPARLSGTGESEALIEAIALIGAPGIERATCESVTYIHILFEQHEIILSENAWSESFQLTQANARALAQDCQIKASPCFSDADHTGVTLQCPARTCLPNTASAA